MKATIRRIRAEDAALARSVRRRRPDIRVVARLLGREPSTHVTERGAAFAASSVDIGGAAFGEAALGLGTG